MRSRLGSNFRVSKLVIAELLAVHTDEELQLTCSVVKHGFGKPRIHPNPKRIVHDLVGILQFAAHPIRQSFKVRLTREVASKQEPRTDLVLIKVFQKIDAGETGFIPNGNGKAKPRRLAAGRCLGQDQ